MSKTMSKTDNRDMPAMPLQGDSARKAFGSLENHMPDGMTKYEHVVLEFAKALVTNWHAATHDPEDAPTQVLMGAEKLADEYFERIEAHRNR